MKLTNVLAQNMDMYYGNNGNIGRKRMKGDIKMGSVFLI